MSNPYIVTLVVGLFFSGGPPAIRWAVAIIGVVSFECMFWSRHWPHVSKEVSERLAPAVAYSNASAAVNVIVRIVAVITTTFGAFPRLIFLTIAQSMSFVGPATIGSSTAPAMRGLGAHQAISGLYSFIAAGTSAPPERPAPIACPVQRNHCKQAESFPHNVIGRGAPATGCKSGAQAAANHYHLFAAIASTTPSCLAMTIGTVIGDGDKPSESLLSEVLEVAVLADRMCINHDRLLLVG